MRRIAVLACLPLLTLAACKPPAGDEYVERTRIAGRQDSPSPPIASPDATGAIWAPAQDGGKLLYGKPGEPPLFAIECADHAITYTRYAPADVRAMAMLALIGNGHVKRLKVDAARTGKAWLWRGTLPATDPSFDVLTGAREIEATIPGSGSLKLHGSHLPGELVDRCRAGAPPVSAPSPAPIDPEPVGPEDPE